MYIGALREVNRKVYFHPDTTAYFDWYHCFSYNSSIIPSYNTELLLYDFNVNIGDTVLYPHIDSTSILINSIDSVQINNQFRKKYNYTKLSQNSCGGFGNNSSYVEGIGNINLGLLSLWISFFESHEQLSCFEDDEIFYSNVPNCETVGIKKEKIASNLKVYPNPTSENLYLEFSDFNLNEKLTYSFFDISGKAVYSSTIEQSKPIDVSNLKKGLYLLKINLKNKEIKSALITIQ